MFRYLGVDVLDQNFGTFEDKLLRFLGDVLILH